MSVNSQYTTNGAVDTMTVQALTPLYQYVERVGSAPYNVGLDVINTGRIVTPQAATTPWNPATQQLLLRQLTQQTHNRFYSEYLTREILTEVMPLQQADPSTNELIWYESRYGPDLMDEISELAMGREIGFERVAVVQRLKLFGIGYSFSEDFLKTPQSRETIVDTIKQLVIVQLDTACGTAMHALLNAPDRYREVHIAQHTMSTRTLRDIFSEEIDLFDILHADRGLTLMRDKMVRIFAAQGGTFRFLLYSQEIYQQVQASSAQSEYYRAGPPAITARNAGSTPLSEGPEGPLPELGIYKPREILVKNRYSKAVIPKNGIGLLQQIVQIGEFYRMMPKHNSRYEPDSRVNNIKIYDGQNDCYAEIDFMEAVENANIFNPMTGLPYSITDAPYSDNNVVRGTIRDVIWDANGQARAYHGDIPREFYNSTKGHDFGSALVNLLERRRVFTTDIMDRFHALQTSMYTKINTKLGAGNFTDTTQTDDILKKEIWGGTGQGISWDEQQQGVKDDIVSMVNTLSAFFPTNIFLDMNHAPHYVADRSSAAAFWENVVIPYFPPVVIVGSGADAQNSNEARNDILTKLELAGVNPTPEEVRIFAKAWALHDVTGETYASLLGGASVADGITKSRGAMEVLDAKLSQKINTLTPPQRARFEKLYRIVSAYDAAVGGGAYVGPEKIIGYTTARATPVVARQILEASLINPATKTTTKIGGFQLWVANPDITVLPISRETLVEYLGSPRAAYNPFSINSHKEVPYIAAAAQFITRQAIAQTTGAEHDEPQSGPADEYHQRVQQPIHAESFLGTMMTRSRHLHAELPQHLGGRYRVDPSHKRGIVELSNPEFVSNWKHSQAGSGLPRVFNLLRLGEPLNMDSWRFWSHEGLPPAIGMLITRPTITIATANFVACQGGAENGGVYYKASSVGTGDHPRGLFQGQIRAHMAGAVRKPENVHVMRNALIIDVLRGHGAKYFAWDKFKAGPTTWGSNSEESILAFPIPLSAEKPTMLSLTGDFHHEGVHNYFDYRYDFGGQWVGSDRANALYGFKDMAGRRKKNNDKDYEQNNVNVLVFRGQSYEFNPSKQEFSEMTPGSGHLKNTCTIGAKLTRSLAKIHYPDNRDHV